MPPLEYIFVFSQYGFSVLGLWFLQEQSDAMLLQAHCAAKVPPMAVQAPCKGAPQYPEWGTV